MVANFADVGGIVIKSNKSHPIAITPDPGIILVPENTNLPN